MVNVVAEQLSSVQRQPAMRQEVGDQMVFVRGQTPQNVLEIDVGVVPVKPGALNQAQDSGRTLACPQRACK